MTDNKTVETFHVKLIEYTNARKVTDLSGILFLPGVLSQIHISSNVSLSISTHDAW